MQASLKAREVETVEPAATICPTWAVTHMRCPAGTFQKGYAMATHKPPESYVQAPDKQTGFSVKEGKLVVHIGEGAIQLDGRTTHALLNMLFVDREAIVKCALLEQRQDEHAKDRRRTRHEWI